MATRDDLVAAIANRYARGSLAERVRILDEFVAVMDPTANMRLAYLAVGSRAAVVGMLSPQLLSCCGSLRTYNRLARAGRWLFPGVGRQDNFAEVLT